MKKTKLLKHMKECFQIEDRQTVLQHGESVLEYFDDLFDSKKFNWKIPPWFYENKELIKDLLLPYSYIKKYAIYHDCGKPFCKVIDKQGRVHFPEHSTKSFEIFSKVFPDESLVAQLIKRDMDVHLLKAKDIENFCRDKSQAITLLVIGLCEINSNANLFGGIESISFKIKYKQINKRGSKIINKIMST
jgi:hypothetical protein